MTVLQKNAAAGVDVGQLWRTISKALFIGAIVVGVVFAVNSSGEPQGLSPAQIEEANALNKADIGMPQAGTVSPSQTGRIVVGGAAAASAPADKADLLFRQRGAALVDPADRIHKQKAADLTE